MAPAPNNTIGYQTGTIINQNPNDLPFLADPTFNISEVTGRWDHKNITIAIGSGGNDFNGPIDARNQAIIAQAIAAWNRTLNYATSYTLTQTNDPSKADIRIGWATLGGNQLQQTITHVYQQPAGSPLGGIYSAFASGTVIRLADPSTHSIDPVNGIYQNTQGTLLQAVEQGIGYALGLGVSTDPISIMNDSLTTKNFYPNYINDQSDLAMLGGATGGAPITSTTVLPPVTNFSGNTAAVYRFFDSVHGTQFLTSTASERNAIIQSRPDLSYEGVGLTSVKNGDPNAAPVYRFFNINDGTHFFTTDAGEANTVAHTRADMKQEATTIFEHLTQQTGDVAVYRFFNSNDGTHFYTNSAVENASLMQTRPDMVSEGVAFYAPKL